MAVSVLAHVLVLGVLGLRAVAPELRDPVNAKSVVYLQIEPRPLMPGEVARRAVVQPGRSGDTANSNTSRLDPTRPLDEDEQAQFQPRASAAASGTAPAPPASVGTNPWTIQPRSLGDRIGTGLRTRGPGCASPNLLTPAERAICDDRFGERAAAAAPIEGTGNARRDARFAREGARALAEYEGRRRPLAGGVGVVGPQDGPGSNFGMGVAGAHLDQSLRPDSTENIRTRRDGPRTPGQPLTPGGGFSREGAR